MDLPARPIEQGWRCKRSGDCCASVSQIVMTPQEALVLHQVRPDLKFYYHTDQRFVFLQGRPCPLLAYDKHKKALCTEYERRPYNCRRFGCFRPNPTVEPYESEPVQPESLRLGCANLSDRLQVRSVRREYARLQRKAQRWALKHGWSQDMAPTTVGSNVTFYRLSPASPRTSPESPPSSPSLST